MNILTMNQNVFGSSFETTRRTNFTENAISSELIIPDSAVELSYEEMEYVDGGKTVGVYLDITMSAGFVAGVLVGSVTRAMIITQLTTAAAVAGGVFGGPVGVGIAGIIGASVGGIIANQLTKYIVNTIGGEAARELTYNTYAFDFWIPFRKNDVYLNINL